MGIATMVKRRVAVRVLVLVLITVLLFTGTATPVYAEDSPSPFRQMITLRIAAFKLIGISIENILLLRAGVKPTPWRLFQLNSEIIQLNAVYDQINDIIGDSTESQIVLDALAGVRDRAQGIVDDIGMILPPDNQKVRELLGRVRDAAQAIADRANGLLFDVTVVR